MSYNPNIITAAQPASQFASIMNIYPVFQGNTVTFEIECPFDPDEIYVERSLQGQKQEQRCSGIPHLKRDTVTGKSYVYYHVKEEETCPPGNYVYSFHLKKHDPVQHTKTIQTELQVFPLAKSPTISMMRSVRMLLSDDPTETRRQVWSDMELLGFLNIALGEVNSTPTFTYFNLDGVPPIWNFILVIGAEYHALRSLYNIETRDRFSFNDDGISFDINHRSEGFMQMINHLYTTYSTQRVEMKKNFRPRAAAIASSYDTISYFNLRPYVVANLRGFNY